MKRCRVVLVAVLALTLSLAFSASAFATVIPAPDAGYLAGTTKIDLSPYYWNGVGWPPPPVPLISDGTLTVTFSAPQMFACYQPETATHANAWGDDGVVEQTTPVPGRSATTAGTAGPQTVTFTFNTPVETFGFEAASLYQNGGTPVGYSAVVTFKRGGATVDTITKTIPAQTNVTPTTYQGHAQFFAATSSTLFDEVVITATGLPPFESYTGLFVAQYRYELPAPVVSTPASSEWSLAVLAALGVALAIGRKRALVS